MRMTMLETMLGSDLDAHFPPQSLRGAQKREEVDPEVGPASWWREKPANWLEPLFRAVSIIGNLPSVNRRSEFEMDSKWCHFSCRLIETAPYISFQSISAILPGRESQYRFEVRYLSGPHNSHTIGVPITSQAICLHGAVRYQQGRDIQVAITQAGALPADVLHRFEVWCASRWVPPKKVSSDQIERQGLDRKAAGWKTLTKRAMSAVLKTCI